VVVDLHDPSHPTVVGHLVTEALALDVALAGRYAYLATGTDGPEVTGHGGVLVVDVANPTAPAVVGRWSSGDEPDWLAVRLVLDGPYAYVVGTTPDYDAAPLYILDLGDRTEPALLGDANAQWWGGDGYPDLTTADGYVYVAADFEGLRVADLARVVRP
jgi:hypothetical protein